MKVYFVKRDEKKKIISTYARPQFEGQEMLLESSKEIVSFLDEQKKNIEQDNENDQKIAREMRILAIESLKSKNELPPDFEG